MVVEQMETVWTSPQVKEHFEWMQREIAEAMRIPPYLISAGPVHYTKAMNDAWLATEEMRRIATKLYIENTTVRALVRE